MLASIPAHTPEWTIQQLGDPGRTMIELFAWLADSILYRANLIPERQRLAFLKLLGLPLQPAAAATGILSVFTDPSQTNAVTLAKAATVPGTVAFETLSELDVLPVTAQAYVKVGLSNSQIAAQLPLLQGLQQLYNLASVPSGYTTTPVFPNNSADANGVDVFGGTIDQCLWFALLVAKPQNQAAARATLGGKNGQRILSLGFQPALAALNPLAGVGPLTAVGATWQISGNSAAGQPAVYHSLSVAGDTTGGLTQTGVVQLVLPQAADIGAPLNDVRSDSQAGVGPKPPRIDDPDIDSVLVAWIRVHVASALTLNWAGVNAVQIDQRTTYNFVPVGVSDGSANQQFSLTQTQIDPTTFVLEVDMPGLGFVPWKAVDDLAVLQSPDPGVRAGSGGRHGAVRQSDAGHDSSSRPAGSRAVDAGRRRRRGKSAGGHARRRFEAVDVSGKPVSNLTVQQPIATTGGADSEALDHAEQRIPATLRHQERAVTASDYKDLVQEMPGSGRGARGGAAAVQTADPRYFRARRGLGDGHSAEVRFPAALPARRSYAARERVRLSRSEAAGGG